MIRPYSVAEAESLARAKGGAKVFSSQRLLETAQQREELLAACAALVEANRFGMSVTGGWDAAGKDPLYLQCVEAARLGDGALAKARGGK